MSSPHVLVAAGVYPPDIGGPATFAVMLEAVLPSQGVAVSVLPFGTVRHLPKVIRHVVYTYHLWKRAKTATHVFALDGVSVGVPARIVAWLRGRPLIVRLGGDYAWEQGRARFGVTTSLDEFDAAKERLPVRVLAKVQRYVCNAAAAVVVPSSYLKSMVVRWPLADQNVRVIHSVFQTPSVPEVSSEAVSRPYLVSAGRLVPWKGFSVLIETAVRLQKRFQGLSLDIFGDGDERQILQQLIDTNGATDYIHLRGKVDSQMLHRAIAHADAFVLNTGYEGLSHQLLEVLALGVPIVTTDIGGNRELLTHNENALLYPFNDGTLLESTITQLLADSLLRTRLIARGKERVTDFTADAAAQLYATLFKNTV